MSNQNTTGGMERTSWPSGHTHTRDQTNSQPASAEATVETRSPTSQDRRGSKPFISGPRQQDPRSSTAAAAATQASSSALDLQSPSPGPMAYEASQASVAEPVPLNELEMQEAPRDDIHTKQPPPLPQPTQQRQQQQHQSPSPTPQPLQHHHHGLLPSHTRPHQKRERCQLALQRIMQRVQQNQQKKQPQTKTSTSTTTQPLFKLRLHGLFSARLEPPVTKATLSELDVGKTIHNPKLRHDINFDSDLHIRPNLDGERGRRKQEQAQQFWDLLASDLTQFVSNPEAFARVHPPHDESWSLPVLLTTVHDVLQTLVPARDRAVVDEGLNVPLLLQQFARGVIDLERLAEWLGGLLKLHCAPMRDEWVDDMCRELSRGNRRNDVAQLVRGLRSLLGLLEAMKLDVANHQIRCLRPLLIEDTVHFEQRFFSRKIQSGRMPVDDAAPWYASAAATERAHPAVNRYRAAFGDAASSAFFFGLSNLVRPSVDPRCIPKTFVFDEDRLLKLRADLCDTIHLELCMRVYETAVVAAVEPKRERCCWPASDMTEDASEEEDPASFDFNTPPPSTTASPCPSRPSSLVFSTDGSSSGGNSPRSPVWQTPAMDPADARARSQSLYSALLALLASAASSLPPVPRWADLRPKMAVEIYRALVDAIGSSSAPSIDVIEQRLDTAMDPKSPLRLEVENVQQVRLLGALARRVNDFKTMPNVGLFVVAAGGRLHPAHARPFATTTTTDTATATTHSGPSFCSPNNNPTAAAAAAAAAAMAAASAAAAAARHAGTGVAGSGRPVDLRENGGIEDMATRLAHLGLLHWRVWGRLVYDPQPDAPSDIATHPIPE